MGEPQIVGHGCGDGGGTSPLVEDRSGQAGETGILCRAAGTRVAQRHEPGLRKRAEELREDHATLQCGQGLGGGTPSCRSDDAQRRA